MAINSEDDLFDRLWERISNRMDDEFANHISGMENVSENFTHRSEILLNKLKENAKKSLEELQNNLLQQVEFGNITMDEAVKKESEAIKKLEDDTAKIVAASVDSLDHHTENIRQVTSNIKNLDNDIKNMEDVLRKIPEDNVYYNHVQDQITDLYNKRREQELALNRLQKEQASSLSDYQKSLMDKANEDYLKQLEEIEKKRKEDLSGTDDEQQQKKINEQAAKDAKDAQAEKDKKEAEIKNNPFGALLGSLFGGKFSGGDNSDPLGKIVNNIGNTVLKGSGEDKKESATSKLANKGIELLSKTHPILGGIAQAIKNGFDMIHSTLKKSVEDAMDTFTTYMGPINTRLEGTDKDLKALVNTSRESLAVSAYVNQSDYVKKMASLVEQGIAYNLEERSLWATVGEKIATTFNVLDKTLTRLIRLQQFDMTRSALGSEASINRFLNSNYQDTSYMNTAYDTVNQTLLEATSQMTAEQATSFTYNVQKWLGSLYSVGMSDSGVQSLAQGLGYLSTGDISSLSSNNSLMTLLGLALSRSGQSMSGLLTSGLQANDVDIIMQSIVEYLATIADNTDSQVLRNQWSQVLGVTMSDLRAMSNLTPNDIAAIVNEQITYEGALQEVTNQMDNLSSRTSIKEQVDNMINNILFTFGTEIAESGPLYVAFKTKEIVEKLSPILENVPGGETIGAVANVVADLAEFASIGTGVVKTVIDAFKAMRNMAASGTPIPLDSWNSTEYNIGNRGENYTGLIGLYENQSIGYTNKSFYDYSNTSASSTVSSSTTAVKGTEIIDNFDKVEKDISETGKDISSQQEEMSNTIDKLYAALFENQSIPIKVKLASLDEEALDLLNKILARNKQELSSDIERYMENNSSSVQSLTNMLYMVRSM